MDILVWNSEEGLGLCEKHIRGMIRGGEGKRRMKNDSLVLALATGQVMITFIDMGKTA